MAKKTPIQYKMFNNTVKPMRIVYRKKIYIIESFDPVYLIEHYAAKYDGESGMVLGAVLYDCYHPNATPEQIINPKTRIIEDSPNSMKFCLANEIKGEDINSPVLQDELEMCFAIWNLDSCYYLPKVEHVKTHPQWYPDLEHQRLMREGVI
jgi:hypothetical protein